MLQHFAHCIFHISCCAHRVQNPEKCERPVDPMNVAGSGGLEHSGLAAKQEICTDKKDLCVPLAHRQRFDQWPPIFSYCQPRSHHYSP